MSYCLSLRLDERCWFLLIFFLANTSLNRRRQTETRPSLLLTRPAGWFWGAQRINRLLSEWRFGWNHSESCWLVYKVCVIHRQQSSGRIYIWASCASSAPLALEWTRVCCFICRSSLNCSVFTESRDGTVTLCSLSLLQSGRHGVVARLSSSPPSSAFWICEGKRPSISRLQSFRRGLMFAAASGEADLDGQWSWHVQTGAAEPHHTLHPPPPSSTLHPPPSASLSSLYWVSGSGLPEASIMVPSVWRD